MPESVRKFMRLYGTYLGKVHGSKGGFAAANKLTPRQRSARGRKAGLNSGKNLTPEERSERARTAANVRWAKVKKDEEQL
jgi:hypothetical protein